jgi:hypothetical protein
LSRPLRRSPWKINVALGKIFFSPGDELTDLMTHKCYEELEQTVLNLKPLNTTFHTTYTRGLVSLHRRKS